METAMSELRISLRRLSHSPGYVASAVVSLAIGIAVCVAVFSLVNVLVFEDVPGLRDRRNPVRINLAVPIASVMRAALLGLAALDPPSLLGSVGVLALAATAATLPPTLRAARIDPVHALREP